MPSKSKPAPVKHQYFIWRSKYSDRYCVLDELPPSIKEEYRIRSGQSMKGRFPKLPKIKMSKTYRGSGIPDCIHNTHFFLMVSERLKKFIESEAVNKIEFLPFLILDHRGKVVDGIFYIVNVLGTVDCLDRTRTEGTMSATRSSEYLVIKKLRLNEARIPADAKLFRPQGASRLMIVRDDLRNAYEKAKFTGGELIAVGKKGRF